MPNKKVKIYFGAVLCALAILLVVGSFFDLSISKTLCVLEKNQYFSSNFFVAFFEIFGEIALYIILAVCFSITYCYFYKKISSKKALNIIIMVFSVVLGFLAIFLLFHLTLKNAFNHSSSEFEKFASHTQTKILIMLVCALIEFGLLALFKKLSIETLQNLTKWAIVTIVVLVFSNLCVQIFKHIFYRTRFRTMLYVGDQNFDYFTNWFSINHKTFDTVLSFGDDFFKSFPSGHASAISSLFALCLLPLFLQKFDTKKWNVFFMIFSLSISFIVCLSRIMAGAHFLTDVVFGNILTIVPIFVFILFHNFFGKLLSKIETL